MCYWCCWGWPKPIREIYEVAVKKCGGYEGALVYGPAHVVWGDENWDSATYCLDAFNTRREDHSEADLAVVRWSLEQLLLVPDEFKTEPAGYLEGMDPKDFPPPDHWEMAHPDV